MTAKMVPAELSLMDAVLAGGPQGTHREALLRTAKLSKTSFYRVVQPLVEKGVLQEKGGYYHLPLSHDYNYAFKLWRDQERLLQIQDPLRSEILSLVDRIKDEFKDNLRALWLVGSAAHQTMDESSDLDFLVVVRKLQEFEPRGSRDIQLTTWTEKEFREQFRAGDSFLRASLCYGLVLADHGFAQEFYALPLPEPGRKAFRQREELLSQGERRLSFFLREEALEDARQVLSRLAVATGRLMLERLGELPAGKHDLVGQAKLYFGPVFSELLQTCLARRARDRPEIVNLKEQLQNWYRRFLPHADYLNDLVQSLSGSGQAFEVAVGQMLKVVFPDGLALPVQVKSCKGEFSLENALRHWETDSVLVLNALREVPPTRRPELPPTVSEAAVRAGVIVWDSRELLQYHNRVLLEEKKPPLTLSWGRSGRKGRPQAPG